MKFLKAIKYSSIGVFIAGIVAVIQGCSLQKEGALALALLFLIQLCTASPEPAAPTGPPPVIIDALTDVQSESSTTCMQPNQNSVAVTDGAFDFRFLRTGSGGGGSHSNSITVGSGELLLSVDGACTGIAIISFQLNMGGFDASEHTQVFIPVTASTGPAIDCRLEITNDGIPVVELTNVPITPPSVIVDISNVARDKINGISLTDCDSSAASSFTLGPPRFR